MSIPKKLLWSLLIIILLLSAYVFNRQLALSDQVPGSITITDSQNQELMFLSESSDRQENTALHTIPSTVVASTLTAEDKRFATHNGIDWIALSRAMYNNIQAGRIVSGASTISQQVARNLLGTDRPRTIMNKLVDISFALLLEQTYSKDQILDYYLNHIFYGNHSYGIAAAAQTYFDIPLEKLDWNQATLLAAIPQNASNLNPYTNQAEVRIRQLSIAKQLLDAKVISDNEYQDITSHPPQLTPPAQVIQAPHFCYFVLSLLEQKYGSNFWHDHTVRISTTLNKDWYRQSRQLLQIELNKIKDKNVNNAAVLAIDNATGNILSYVGNTDYFDKKHSGAVDMVQAQRQPGSALKPFIYLGTIIFSGLGTGSIFYDVPTSFLTDQNTPYTPLNYDLDYHGPVTMREALANSYNIPAVKALEKIGLTQARQILKQAGIQSIKEDNDHYGLSLALGSAEVSLYDLTNAYRTLANQGSFSLPNSIITVTIDGEPTTWPIAHTIDQPNWHDGSLLITDILQDKAARLAEFGENNALEFPFPVAAKTGTSRNFNDNWTIGFTPKVTVGVWVGNSDGQAMEQVSGITGAGPIFHQVMDTINNHQNKAFSQLAQLVSTKICLPSGLLPQPLCNHTSDEYFLSGTQPKTVDTWYQQDGLHLPAELNYWQQRFTTKSISGLAITTPHDQDVFRVDPEIPITSQKIKCSIYAPDIRNLTIKLNDKIINDKIIGHNQNCTLPYKSGQFTLKVTGINTRGIEVSDQVRFSIEQKR